MNTPYYQDDLVTLYHGDCREVTAWLEADVLVTDPPYGIDYRSNSRRQTLDRSIDGDSDTLTRDRALRMWRQHMSEGEIGGGMWRPALMFGTWRRRRPLNTKMLLIWDTKGALGMGDTSLPWKPSHQEIYVLGRGFEGHRGSDVLRCAPVQSLGYNGRSHPHEKPVELMADLIRKCPWPTVADPFAGSGSTLLAARMEGRKAIGVETREHYCEAIAKRLQSAQDTLFGGVA